MNDYDYLNQACEFAKVAADMTLPLEEKPAPEAGSQILQGMTNTATANPMSVGAQVYADVSDAEALAQAKEEAAQVLAKEASIKEAAAMSLSEEAAYIRACYGL